MYMCTTSFVSHAAAEDDGPPVRRREEKRRRVSYNVLVENQSKSIYCREGKDAIDSEETRACIVRVMAAAAACRAGWGADMTRRGREEREGIRLLAGPWRARTILRRRYIIESFLCRARLFKLYTYVRIHVYPRSPSCPLRRARCPRARCRDIVIPRSCYKTSNPLSLLNHIYL